MTNLKSKTEQSENKTCTNCLSEKPRTEFHIRRASVDGLRPTCKVCAAVSKAQYHIDNKNRVIEKVGIWKSNNRDRVRASAKKHGRKYDLMKHYGWTLEDYDRAFVAQNGKCAICKNPPRNTNSKNKHLHVDHDHLTGVVRGLLCDHCNRMLGLALDSAETLRNAATYLEIQSVANNSRRH